MQASLDELTRQLDLVPPTPANAAASTRPAADRPASLEGAAVAFLDNSKDNAALLLRTYAELLEGSFAIGSTSFFNKPLHTRVADEAQLQVAAQSACAIVAIGDWGSCVLCSSHDVVRLEDRGCPSVLICTDVFLTTARAHAKALGMPQMAVVTIANPLSGISPAEVAERARTSVSAVVAALTAGARTTT